MEAGFAIFGSGARFKDLKVERQSRGRRRYGVSLVGEWRLLPWALVSQAPSIILEIEYCKGGEMREWGLPQTNIDIKPCPKQKTRALQSFGIDEGLERTGQTVSPLSLVS